MTRFPATTCALVLFLAASAGLAEGTRAQEHAVEPSGHHGSAAGEEAVRAAVEAFHGALSDGDSLRALEMLAPEATVYESGHAETREEYRAGHLRADIAFSSSVSRTLVRDEVVLHGPLALYTSVARRTGTFRDREIDSTGAETIVLRLDDRDRWRIRHIHWSSR